MDICLDLREVLFSIYDSTSVLAGGKQTELMPELVLLKSKVETLVDKKVLDSHSLKVALDYIDAAQKGDGEKAHFKSRMIFRETVDEMMNRCREHKGPSYLREAGMDERAKAIAEEAAAKAVLLQGSQISQQVAKELSGEVLHQSPVSAHCEAVLEKPPECSSFREIRSWVLCKAWDILEKEKRTKLPVGEAWQLARRTCRTE